MSGTPEMRNLEYDVTIIEPTLETPLSALRLNTKGRRRRYVYRGTRGDKNKLVRLSLSWKFGDIDFSKMHVSLSRRATHGLGLN